MAEGAVPAGALAGAATFRSIGELAELCGHYCWLERRMFALAGSRASGPVEGEGGAAGSAEDNPGAAEGEIRVLLSQMSARHGFLAAQWRDRLPVRAGVVAEALVVPPPGPAADVLDLIGSAPDLALVLGGLALQFLPGLRESYDRNLAWASPVSEAPVRSLLEWATLSTAGEIRSAENLLGRLTAVGERAGSGGEFTSRVQRLLGGASDTFPGARAS